MRLPSPPYWPPSYWGKDSRPLYPFSEAGFACGCRVLGGSDEFCGVKPNLASSSRILSKSITTNARTAGFISASSSGGMACGMGLVDDIMHVIPKNAVCVQINFSQIGPRGVNGYPLAPRFVRMYRPGPNVYCGASRRAGNDRASADDSNA